MLYGLATNFKQKQLILFFLFHQEVKIYATDIKHAKDYPSTAYFILETYPSSFAAILSSRPQAMKGSPEGQVPLALSAEDRPPRRRSKRQAPVRASIIKDRRAGYGPPLFFALSRVGKLSESDCFPMWPNPNDEKEKPS